MIIKNLLRIFVSYKLVIFKTIFFEIIYVVLGYKGNNMTQTKNRLMANNIPCPYFFLIKIIKVLKKYKFKKFVDLGCGSGRVIYFMNKNLINKFYLGIEYDKKVFKFVKNMFKNNKKISILNSNFLSFNHNKFKANCYFLNNPFTSNKSFKTFFKKLTKQIPPKKKIIFVFVNFDLKMIKSNKKIHLIDEYKITNVKNYCIALLKN